MKRKKNKRSKRVVILADDYNLSGKRKVDKLADCEIGRCVDCGEPFLIRHDYIVRGAVWRKAGMEDWDSGYSHIACLEARLGRSLAWGDDILLRYAGHSTTSEVTMRVHPDYFSSPEYTLHGGGKQMTAVIYVILMAAVIVAIDFLFFKNRFWERLMVNIGIVLVFTAFYFRFLKRP